MRQQQSPISPQEVATQAVKELLQGVHTLTHQQPEGHDRDMTEFCVYLGSMLRKVAPVNLPLVTRKILDFVATMQEPPRQQETLLPDAQRRALEYSLTPQYQQQQYQPPQQQQYQPYQQGPPPTVMYQGQPQQQYPPPLQQQFPSQPFQSPAPQQQQQQQQFLSGGPGPGPSTSGLQQQPQPEFVPPTTLHRLHNIPSPFFSTPSPTARVDTLTTTYPLSTPPMRTPTDRAASPLMKSPLKELQETYSSEHDS